MGVREFLLDYAEKAPNATRASNDVHWFLVEGRPRCALAFAASLPCDAIAGMHYGLDDDEYGAIVHAADGEDGPWRHVLQKLAEPEVRA